MDGMVAFHPDLAKDSPELEALAHIVGWAFGNSAQDASKWLERAGAEHVRVGYGDGEVVAGVGGTP